MSSSWTPDNWAIGKVVGRAIREHRIAKGWDQHQLAEKVGIAATSISRHEHGAVTPNTPTIVRYAHALGVKPSELIDLDYTAPRLLGHSPHKIGDTK